MRDYIGGLNSNWKNQKNSNRIPGGHDKFFNFMFEAPTIKIDVPFDFRKVSSYAVVSFLFIG